MTIQELREICEKATPALNTTFFTTGGLNEALDCCGYTYGYFIFIYSPNKPIAM